MCHILAFGEYELEVNVFYILWLNFLHLITLRLKVVEYEGIGGKKGGKCEWNWQPLIQSLPFCIACYASVETMGKK